MNPPPPPRNRGWLWFLFIMGTLGVLFVGGLFATTRFAGFFNLSPQLKPEELQAALVRWKEKGPRDYRMVYKEAAGNSARMVKVEVRGGKVRAAYIDGQPVQPTDRYQYYGMDALFDDVLGFLDQREAAGGGSRFLRASFDPDDGHLSSYVYHDSGNRQSVEVEVQVFQPLAAGETP